jgi:predicted ATPase/Tfp pilus assembly protein PilF
MAELPAGTVTLLFTDIADSTEALQGDNGYGSLLDMCRGLLRAAFRAHGGHEIDSAGARFVAVFTRATDAVRAAASAQHALAAHPWPGGVAMRARMGLHTGEPRIETSGYAGIDIQRAERLMALGHAGQVLLSATTCALALHDLPEGASLRDLEIQRFRGLAHPEHLFQLVTGDIPPDFPPLKTLDAPRHNLPAQRVRLIGRERERGAITALLRRDDVRLVTLTGPGGTGKTRLSQQVTADLCDEFADGAVFVELAPIGDPALVVSTIAQALDVKESGAQPLAGSLKVYLRDKHMLLVLDNFEQIVAAAPLVSELLAAAPRLKMLVTSRVPLHLDEEHEYQAPPLALPDLKTLPPLDQLIQYPAVTLFMERAQAVKPDFQITGENAQAVAAICARLDGLPLAIELAAARSKLLPPRALLARLDRRLSVLTGGARELTVRQQTLRGAIAWSYDLLDEAERTLFRRLAVFVGDCTLEAMEAICGAMGDRRVALPDVVASLIDKSLLRRQPEETGEIAGQPRFTMLETIREYAREQMAASGEAEALRKAHAEYYLALVERLEPQLMGPEQAACMDLLELDHDQLRAALAWSRERARGAELGLRLATALWWFWGQRGYLSEGRGWLESTLAAAQALPRTRTLDALRAKALYRAGVLAWYQSDHERAIALCEESLQIAQALGDGQGIAWALHNLGRVAYLQGDYPRAVPLLEQSLAGFREAGDNWGIPWSLDVLGQAAVARGDYGQAERLWTESLELRQSIGDVQGIPWPLNNLGEVAAARGEYARARTLFEESLALFREQGVTRPIQWVLDNLGQVALAEGDYGRATSLFEESLATFRELGEKEGAAHALAHLGEAALSQDDQVGAAPLLEESLELFRDVGARHGISRALQQMARAAYLKGDNMRAARLFGVVSVLREAMGAPFRPVVRKQYESTVAATRAQLDEASFTSAWAQGRAMSLEQAIAYALRVNDMTG